MANIKELNQKEFGMRIVKDLGIVKINTVKNPVRRAIFECTKCKDNIEATVSNIKTKNGIEKKLCPKCSKLQGDEKKTKKLDQKNYKLTIIEDLGVRNTSTGKSKARYAIFKCPICEENIKLQTATKRTKEREACDNCLRPDRNSKDPLYAVWNGIKQRCYSKNRKDYSNYGGKGVTMAEEWVNDPVRFISWCRGNGWKEGLVLDKDIKCKELGISPAIYSPETISFITVQENAEEANAKRVQQFTLDEVYITTHVSATKAAKSCGDRCNKSPVINACNGILKTAYGYKWQYE